MLHRQDMGNGFEFGWVFVFSRSGSRVTQHQCIQRIYAGEENYKAVKHIMGSSWHHIDQKSSKGLQCQRKAVKHLLKGSMSLSFLYCTALLFRCCNMSLFNISRLFWKDYSYSAFFFLNYINMNFSINSHWLLDLQMVRHINIYVCQSCSFKEITEIYKEEQKGNSKHDNRKQKTHSLLKINTG